MKSVKEMQQWFKLEQIQQNFIKFKKITEHKITTYSDIEAFLDSEFQIFNNLSTNAENETQDLVPTFLEGGTSSLNDSNGGTRSPICTIGADITTLASCNAEDGAVAKGNVVNANAEPLLHFTKEETVNQPPPKPPDLHSHVGVLDGAEDNADLNCSGGCLADVVDNGIRSSAEVSASVRRKWTLSLASGRTTAMTVTNGGLWVQQLRRFFLLNPPPLLAVVLLWNRRGDGEDWSRDGWQWSAAKRGGKKGVQRAA
ncbi:hypothetical protein PIB30_045601 [Stylosanthes scabra]|uniref:Uncharacterized protein n=1 Tax=Stylosanthes scabra TaxID=79078 RepID=A0ABU6RG90_9FABA|nr:hypothetical protein [Stylosanthes scabra]